MTRPTPRPNDPTWGLAVIVPTRDRVRDLSRSLPALLDSIEPATDVLVIDQSHDDATAKAVDRIGAGRVRYLHCPSKGSSNARNFGLASTSAPLVGFVDDDCIVPNGWDKQVREILAADGIGAFFGAVIAEPFDWRRGYTPSVPSVPDRVLVKVDPTSIPGIMGANMAFRREALIEIGGFDPYLGAGAPFRSAEEVDVAYRLLLAGYPLRLAPSPAVIHFGFRTYASGASRQLVRATHLGMAAYFAKHIRSGDRRAARTYARYLAQSAGIAARNALAVQRPIGVSRPIFTLLGAARSFRYSVDGRRRLFQDRRAPGSAQETG